MIDVFSEGREQDITHVLANRDARVNEQQLLYRKLQDNQSLINAKLNIPGPIKNNFYLAALFNRGFEQFTANLEIDQQIFWDVATGPEVFAIVNKDAKDIKQAAIKFEDDNEFGRLFDIDILIYKSDGLHPLSRSEFKEPERKCLICDKPAKVCARSRTHSVTEMQQYINKLINNNLELL